MIERRKPCSFPLVSLVHFNYYHLVEYEQGEGVFQIVVDLGRLCYCKSTQTPTTRAEPAEDDRNQKAKLLSCWNETLACKAERHDLCSASFPGKSTYVSRCATPSSSTKSTIRRSSLQTGNLNFAPSKGTICRLPALQE